VNGRNAGSEAHDLGEFGIGQAKRRQWSAPFAPRGFGAVGFERLRCFSWPRSMPGPFLFRP
jgi:hypothetical protein